MKGVLKFWAITIPAFFLIVFIAGKLSGPLYVSTLSKTEIDHQWCEIQRDHARTRKLSDFTIKEIQILDECKAKGL
jgi:hypothetical protein